MSRKTVQLSDNLKTVRQNIIENSDKFNFKKKKNIPFKKKYPKIYICFCIIKTTIEILLILYHKKEYDSAKLYWDFIKATMA